jgi:hypothetical protein
MAESKTTQAPPTSQLWAGFPILHGDYGIIASLTPYTRSYIRKVLTGTRQNTAVEEAARRFFTLRHELLQATSHRTATAVTIQKTN